MSKCKIIAKQNKTKLERNEMYVFILINVTYVYKASKFLYNSLFFTWKCSFKWNKKTEKKWQISFFILQGVECRWRIAFRNSQRIVTWDLPSETFPRVSYREIIHDQIPCVFFKYILSRCRCLNAFFEWINLVIWIYVRFSAKNLYA